jgi:hypothetical protein
MDIALKTTAAPGRNHRKGTLAINNTMLPIIVEDSHRCALK